MSKIIKKLGKQYEPLIAVKKQKSIKWRWFFGTLFVVSVSTGLYVDSYPEYNMEYFGWTVFGIALVLMVIGQIGFAASFTFRQPGAYVTEEQLIAEISRLFERDKEGIEKALYLILHSSPEKYHPYTIWSQMEVSTEVWRGIYDNTPHPHIQYISKPDVEKMDGIKSIDIWPKDDKWLIEVRQILLWDQSMSANNHFQIQLPMPE